MATKTDLVAAGLRELGETPAPEAVRLVKAVAAMLALPQGRKKRAVDGPKLAVSPAEVYQAVLETEQVLCVPVDARWFGRLGGVLKNLPDFDKDTLATLCAWLRSGGVRGWPGGQPSFSHLITHLDKWLGRAVAWGKAGNAVATDTDWSMFR